MKPLVLIPSGDADADFTYASGFPVETGLYIRFGDDDDVLVASPLEIDRARAQSKARVKLGFGESGYEEHGPFASWPRLAAKMLREKGHEEARVSPRLQAAYLEELRATGLAVEIDRGLFREERRHKSPDEAAAIRSAQQAAEAAVVEVVRQLAQAEIKDGLLWLEGRPLTSERLYARAQLLLCEMGFTCPDMIG